jgi:hypothetical protein
MNSCAAVFHRDEDISLFVGLGANSKFSLLPLHLAHRFNAVPDQVVNDTFQLSATASHRLETIGEFNLDLYAIAADIRGS